MSDYEYEVGKEYKTRNGLPCVVIANDPAVGLVWRVLLAGGGWTLMSSDICKPESQFHPVPPDRTVDQRCYVGKRAVYYGTIASKSSLVRWTIGSDGRPAYAVRLDENGEPMYRVEPVAKGGGDA